MTKSDTKSISRVTYSDAGVSIDAANETVRRIAEIAKTTFNERTLTNIGSFGGMFDANFPEMEQPILVSSADGVGTKLKIAFETGIHDTIGQDLVNHCVGDILVQGAKPLFFMDYFASGLLSPDVTESVVKGLAIACKNNGCVLLGGETAEMPGFYSVGEYDLAGFIVGIVDRKNVIDGSRIEPCDVVLGLASNGLHTNGYSLARKLFFEVGEFGIDSQPDELEGVTVGEALILPHRSYLPAIEPILEGGKIKGLAHITGGGLLENIPRILPENTAIELNNGSWNIPPIFGLMQRLGNVDTMEMFRTFNMGIGMVLICDNTDAIELMTAIENRGQEVYEIGKVKKGRNTVSIN